MIPHALLAADLAPLKNADREVGSPRLLALQVRSPTTISALIARQFETVGLPTTVMAWIGIVMVVDAGGSLNTQRLLGAITWLMLIAALWRMSPSIRVQTLTVVLFATAVEYICSPLLEFYTYRLDNIPAYVPPGHGLVYLAALAIGSMRLIRTHEQRYAVAVVTVGGAWAIWGLFGSAQPDILGAFWFVCLIAFLLWGPNRPLYIGAFIVVSYLEIFGTTLGVWQWQPYDPIGLIPIGNPPSGVAGGYGWFDLAALLLAPRLLSWIRQSALVASLRPGLAMQANSPDEPARLSGQRGAR